MKYSSARFVMILGVSLALVGFAPSAQAAEKDAAKETRKETAAKNTAKKDAGSKEEKKGGDKGNAGGRAATVNGTVITMAEYETETSRYERQMEMSGQTPDEAQVTDMKKKVLDGLIGREVLRQEAAKLGVKVEDQEVNKQIDGIKKRFPSEEEFKNALTRMNLTEDGLKKQFSQDLAIKKMIDQQVAGKVVVSPEETRAFYDTHPEMFKMPEMVRASHILVKADPQASDADKAKAREKMAAVQKRIKGGEDFAAVAKEVSECPSSENGGDLDFFQKGQMVGPFEDTAFSLKTGEVSDVVETQFGYHIIKVTDKKESGTIGYDEIKDRIEQHIKQDKVNQQVSLYIDQLKSKAKIETYAK
ncbi:MAG: peptidylprolyl isomerase [Syntrophobacteraceae bacterium]|nr:peptidylprolyl isomerase [Syntrophobacteraceae bacterium]